MKPDFLKKEKGTISFLYYVYNGVCKSNTEMAEYADGFQGWLCASHVIRNQNIHKTEDVEACLKALREFVEDISGKTRLKEQDLLEYI